MTTTMTLAEVEETLYPELHEARCCAEARTLVNRALAAGLTPLDILQTLHERDLEISTRKEQR